MNDYLTERELEKVFLLYDDYKDGGLKDFIRMIWKEAYDLGKMDGYVEGFNKQKEGLT